MTISQCLKKYHNIEIELFLAHVLKKPREYIFLHPEKSLSARQILSLSAMIKRRLKGEPIAYILGYKDFYGLRFKVNKHVLVPRPETECMVEQVVRDLRSSPPNLGGVARQTGRGGINIFDYTTSPRLRRGTPPILGGETAVSILDIGTGSGCVAVSIAKQLKQFQGKNFIPSSDGMTRSDDRVKFQITASDISNKALAVAKQNAKTHKVKISFQHSNILENVRMSPDVIVANLPYLPFETLVKEGGWKEWKNNSSAATAGLKFEPQAALFAKEHGLFLIRKLLDEVAGRDKKPKLIYLEFDPRQKIGLQKLIKKTLPRSKSVFFKDFSDRWRFVRIEITK